jgi:hypothetical protein
MHYIVLDWCYKWLPEGYLEGGKSSLKWASMCNNGSYIIICITCTVHMAVLYVMCCHNV